MASSSPSAVLEPSTRPLPGLVPERRAANHRPLATKLQVLAGLAPWQPLNSGVALNGAACASPATTRGALWAVDCLGTGADQTFVSEASNSDFSVGLLIPCYRYCCCCCCFCCFVDRLEGTYGEQR